MKKFIYLLFAVLLYACDASSQEYYVNPHTGQLDYTGGIKKAWVSEGKGYILIGSDTVSTDTLFNSAILSGKISVLEDSVNKYDIQLRELGGNTDNIINSSLPSIWNEIGGLVPKTLLNDTLNYFNGRLSQAEDTITALKQRIGTSVPVEAGDITPPHFVSALISDSFNNCIKITFDEPISFANQDSTIANLTITGNTNPVSVDSLKYSGLVLEVYTDTLKAGVNYYLAYISENGQGIKDTADNYISLMSGSIRNNLLTEIQEDLIHAWGFNGNMTDAIGGANGVYSSMKYVSDAIEGSYSWNHAYFSGMQGITTSGVTLPDSGTILCLVKVTEQNSGATNILWGNNNNTNSDPGMQAWVNRWGSGDLGIIVYSTDGSTRREASAPAGSLSLNEWVELAFVYTPDSMKIYIDGEQSATTFGINPDFGKNSDFIIGNTEGLGYPFFGYIDGFKIFNRPFTAKEVQDYDFSQGTTNIVDDENDGDNNPPTGYVTSGFDTTKYDIVWAFEPNKVPVSDTGQQYWNTNNNFSKYFPGPVTGGVQGFPDYSSPPEEHHPYPHYYNRDPDRTNEFNEDGTKNSIYVPLCNCRGDTATTGNVYIRGYGSGDSYYQVLEMTVDSGYHGGPFWGAYIPGNNTELYKEIVIAFKPGFNSSWGGKISKYHSITAAHTYEGLLDGFRNNISFNADSAVNTGYYPQTNGGLKHYYGGVNPSQANKQYNSSYPYLDTIGGSDPANYWRFPKDGSFFRINHRIVLNDLGQSNGFIEVWINGKFSHRMSGLLMRTTENTFIDQAVFWFFFGGNSGSQAAKRDESAYILYDAYYQPKPGSGLPFGRDFAETSGRHQTIESICY